MTTAELTIRLPLEDLEFAENYAREHRVSLAELVDRQIRRLRERVTKTSEMRTRLAGSLRSRDGAYHLTLKSGETIPLTRDQDLPISPLLEQRVLVSGMAEIASSGEIRRIRAERVEPLGRSSSIWDEAPRSLRHSIDETGLRSPKSEDFASVFGSLSGDESDEEVFAALDELS